MFNVCPGCGQYREDKQVEDSCAICPECGHRMPFRQLPLLVVTGASCSGKSTVLLNLAGTADIVCLDSDILWRDEFSKPEDDYMQYRNLWLRVVKNVAQSGRPVALFGSSTPGQFERCTERRFIGAIHYLALVCSDDELERRLKARPSWRRSGDEDVVLKMKDFNCWLRENAAQSGMTLIDTSALSVAQATQATLAWMRDSISQRAGKK